MADTPYIDKLLEPAVLVPLLVAAIGGVWVLYRHFTKDKSPSEPNPQSLQGNNVANAQTVNMGITLEQYEDGLKRKETEVRIELASDSKPDKDRIQELEIELNAVYEKLTDTEKSFQKRIEDLTSTAQSLDGFEGDIDPTKIELAKEALSHNDSQAAESLLMEIIEKSDTQRAKAAYQLGKIFESEIKYDRASEYYDKAVQSSPENTRYLNASGMMADIMGLYEKAEAHYQQSLEIIEKTLGKDHLSIAPTLNNLAELYRAQEFYDRAEPLFQRSLIICEKALGRDDPSVAITLNNLGLLYTAQHLDDKAESFYQQSLEIKEKTLGKDNSSVASTLNNLAFLYKKQDFYDKALQLYLRSMEITERTLGQHHPHLANTLNNLANLYETRNHYDKAELLYIRSIKIYEKALGENHPNTKTVVENYRLMIEERDSDK